MRSRVCLLFGFSILACTAAAFALFCPSAHAAAPNHDLVVAKDGSGHFTTVQAALDSVPKDNLERRVIFIKNGTYTEHLRIESSFLTLLGEDRKKTRLVWAINDARFRPEDHRDGRGVATLNIEDASDLVLDNLTVENPANLGGKPFAVISRGRGTRIVIQNADIIGLGGDTLSLWTKGLYYHRNIHVSGTYHFVGPRGTCYMADSVIEALGKDKDALFNEGVDDEQERFVLHRCTFVSKMPFRLGSWFRDAAWYFVDCTFPSTLSANGAPHVSPSKGYQFKWPTDRIYYAGCKGPDYPWLKDNLDRSPAKAAATISAAWTFRGLWDPESTAEPVVSAVSASMHGISITFSEPVTVKGCPLLVLGDGSVAKYHGGSGTDLLLFALPPGSVATAKSFDLSGGTIQASRASVQPRFVTSLLLSR